MTTPKWPRSSTCSASEDDRRWARGLLAEAEHCSGAFVFEGSMVDEPVLARARQLFGGD